jgi:hypothetical protein
MVCSLFRLDLGFPIAVMRGGRERFSRNTPQGVSPLQSRSFRNFFLGSGRGTRAGPCAHFRKASFLSRLGARTWLACRLRMHW